LNPLPLFVQPNSQTCCRLGKNRFLHKGIKEPLLRCENEWYTIICDVYFFCFYDVICCGTIAKLNCYLFLSTYLPSTNCPCSPGASLHCLSATLMAIFIVSMPFRYLLFHLLLTWQCSTSNNVSHLSHASMHCSGC